jgi:hypothetical protein
MPRGLPDYGIPQYALATPSIDMATLVLAQTGICSVDGKGRIFYADNFHAGTAGLELYVAGDAKYAYPATTHTYIPPLSLGMNPGTVNGGGRAEAYKILTIPDTPKIGLEVMVAAGTDHTVVYNFDLRYCYADGHAAIWWVTWDTGDGSLWIYSGTQFIKIDTYYINMAGWIWTPIKIVGNLETLKWDRLLIGNKGYNLSSYTSYPSTYPSKSMLLVWLSCSAKQASTAGDFGRYGYMILTIDEP